MHVSPAATPEPAPGLDEAIPRAITLLEEVRDLVQQDIEGRGDLLELVMLAARLAETGRDIRQAAAFTAVNELAAVTAVPQPRRARAKHARHRFPRPRNVAPGDGQGVLEFPGGTRLAGAVAAALVALRTAGRVVRNPHSWKAAVIGHKVAAAFVALGVGATVATTAAVVIPPAVHALASPGAPAAAGFGGAPGLYGATPLNPAVAPAMTQAAPKARTGKADTTTAGLVAVVSFPPLAPAVAVPPPPQPQPAPSTSSPAPSWSPSFPPPPSSQPGQLQVSSTQVDVSDGQPDTITLTAPGGPVTWSATTTSADIILSAARWDKTPLPAPAGTLYPGERVILTIAPALAQDGQPTATVNLGNGLPTITVTLPGPSPSPSPTPTPTGSPTGSPTPSPTSS